MTREKRIDMETDIIYKSLITQGFCWMTLGLSVCAHVSETQVWECYFGMSRQFFNFKLKRWFCWLVKQICAFTLSESTTMQALFIFYISMVQLESRPKELDPTSAWLWTKFLKHTLQFCTRCQYVIRPLAKQSLKVMILKFVNLQCSEQFSTSRLSLKDNCKEAST